MSGFRGLLAGLERQLIVTRTTAGKEVQRERGWHPNGDQVLPRGVGCERIKEGKRTSAFAGSTRSRMRRASAAPLNSSWQAVATARLPRLSAVVGRPTASKHDAEYALVRRADLSADSRPQDSARTPRHPRVRGPDQPRDLGASARDYHGAKKTWGARKRKPRFLMTGLLKCSCSKPYYTRANPRQDRTKRQEHYYCSSAFRGHGPKCGARALQRTAVDQEITAIVKQRFRDPKLLLWLVEQSGRQVEARTDATKLERELSTLEANRIRVVDGWEEGIIAKADFVKRTAALDQQARELRARLPSKAPALDARRTIKAVATFFAGFEDQSFEDQRRILRIAFKEFRVENGAIPGWTLNGAFLGSMDGAKVSRDSRVRAPHGPA
jgi:hypothetical protein